MSRVLFGLLLSFIMATQAKANLINISTETYHVSGNTGHQDYEWYNNSSSNPISGVVTDSYGFHAKSSAGTFSAYSEIMGNYGQSAYAESTYTFTSNVDALIIDYNGYVGSSNAYEFGVISIILSNVSKNEEIFNFKLDPYNNGTHFDPETNSYIWSYSIEGAIAFMPGSDEYRLFFSSWSRLGEGGGYSSRVDVNFRPTPVPEPSVTVLVGMGLIFFVFFARKKGRVAPTNLNCTLRSNVSAFLSPSQ